MRRRNILFSFIGLMGLVSFIAIINKDVITDSETNTSKTNIRMSKEVGDIKNKMRESILAGDIKNNYEDAYKLMLKIGNDMGLIKV